MAPDIETVDTEDQLSSTVLLGIAVAGGIATVIVFWLIGGWAAA